MIIGFLDISDNISVLEVGPADAPDEPLRRVRRIGQYSLEPGEQVIARGRATITMMSGWSSRPGITPIPTDLGDYLLTDRRLCVVREILVGDARLADDPASDAVRLIRSGLKEKGDREYIEAPVKEMAGFLGGRLYIVSETGYYQLWVSPESEGAQLFSRIPGLGRTSVPLRDDGNDYIETKSHSQPGLFMCVVGAVLCAIPIALSPLLASGATNPEVCYAWSSVFWVGMAAFLVRWASIPRKLRIDRQGVKLISLLGSRFIPCAEIQLLSPVKRLRRVLAPGDNTEMDNTEMDNIEMEEYTGISITRSGGRPRIVAMELGEAQDVELFYRCCAPAQNLSRLAHAAAARNIGSERADLQREMDCLVRDMRRAPLVQDLGAIAAFTSTVMITIVSVGDYNLRNEYIPLQTRVFIGVLAGIMILTGYFFLFAHAYTIRLENRRTALVWRMNNFNSSLPMDGAGPFRLDPMFRELANRSTISLRRMALLGGTMLGGLSVAFGVEGLVHDGGVYSALGLLLGFMLMAGGIASLYFFRQPKKM